MVVAPLPFLIFFYRTATTKVNDMAQEDLAYHSTNFSALFFVALVGFALGFALLVFGRHLRPKDGEVSP